MNEYTVKLMNVNSSPDFRFGRKTNTSNSFDNKKQ